MLKTNEYFDGKVKSIAFNTEALPATVGVMEPGEYVCNTAEKEEVTIVSGAMFIKFTENGDESVFEPGDSFNVDANSSFYITVKSETAYLCLYG